MSSAALRHQEDHMGFPPWPTLAVILATIGLAIWILLHDGDKLDPISPN